MQIRRTNNDDLKFLDAIFNACREYMRAQGNPTQWSSTYPTSKVVEQDILDGTGYVCTDESTAQILGSFALSDYEEEYDRLKGTWRFAEPYVVVHRLGTVPGHGVGRFILQQLQAQYPHIRIDTHKDNKTMLHLLESMGFHYCGTVFYPGAGERVAYDYHR